MKPADLVAEARQPMRDAVEADRQRGIVAAANTILTRYSGDREEAARVVRAWAVNDLRWNEIADRILQKGPNA